MTSDSDNVDDNDGNQQERWALWPQAYINNAPNIYKI